MMDGDIRVNTYDDGSSDALTGEQQIRNFNINFGPQHPAAQKADRHPSAAPCVLDPCALLRNRSRVEPPDERHHTGDGRWCYDPVAVGL